ncbi:LuxR C-terminal-related transcriptional regulator [Streptomyces wedmorensis]
MNLSDPVKGFAAVAAALSGPPQQRHRWVLGVDDLHLLDATSALLLRQLMDAGVARLIGTVRTGEPVTEAVEALMGGDAVHRIDLTAFSKEQAHAVLRAALGGPVGQRTLRRLYTASGGNVLYLRELVLGALQTGALANDGEIWELTAGRPMGTPRLAELIDTRLAAADPQAGPALELLALVEPLALADAQQIVSFDVLADLEEAALVQVVTDRRRTAIRLDHPLYGEALRAATPDSRRRTLLLDQAARVEAYGARRRDDTLRLATWHLSATGTADPHLLIQAATLACHSHDYQQTVTLLQALPERHHTITSRLLRGEALTGVGDWRQAEAVLAEADAAATDESEIVAVTISRTFNLFMLADRTDEALAVNDASYRRLTSPASRRALRINEGTMHALSGQPALAVALLDDLEPDIHQAPDATAWLLGAMFRPPALAMLGRTTEAIAEAEHAYSVHLRANDLALAPHPAAQLISLALALTDAGELDRAREIGERAFNDLLTARTPVPRVWAAINLARAEWLAGHLTSARHWYAEAAALARTHHQPRALHPALVGLAATASLLGDIDAAAQAQSDAAVTRPTTDLGLFVGEERLGEAWLHAARGHQAQARTVLTDAAEAARNAGHVASEAVLLTDVARLHGAKEVVGRLTEIASICDGAFAPARAHLAAALAADDPGQLLDATKELQAVGADLLAAEAATASAAAWRRAGETRRAAAATQQAQACAARCKGARTPLLNAAETAAPLTPRQREIALLAAFGTSSKDIAATLHLSVRTVDNHLQHAYAKLGVTTRRELAESLGTTPTRRMT